MNLQKIKYLAIFKRITIWHTLGVSIAMWVYLAVFIQPPIIKRLLLNFSEDPMPLVTEISGFIFIPPLIAVMSGVVLSVLIIALLKTGVTIYFRARKY